MTSEELTKLSFDELVTIQKKKTRNKMIAGILLCLLAVVVMFPGIYCVLKLQGAGAFGLLLLTAFAAAALFIWGLTKVLAAANYSSFMRQAIEKEEKDQNGRALLEKLLAAQK